MKKPRYLHMMKAMGKLLSAFFVTTVLFQNCGKQNGFQTVETSLRDPASVDGLGDGSQTVKECSLSGTKFPVGGTVSGYIMNSVVYPITCGNPVIRTCLPSGQFDGSVPLSSACLQQCRHPDTLAAVDANTEFVYYTKSTGTTQADCDSAKVVSKCQASGASAGKFLPAVPTARYSSCKVQGQTCGYPSGTGVSSPSGNMTGATVSGFSSASATYPSLCGSSIKLTCNSNGTWLNGSTVSSVPLYSSCTQKCLHPDTKMPVNSGTTYQYYTKNSGSASECSSAMQTATCSASTGTFGTLPATKYSSCTVVSTVLLGSALYEKSCASCHGALATSNLLGRGLTADIVANSPTKIAQMASLKGTLNTDQVNSLVSLLNNTTPSPTTKDCTLSGTTYKSGESISGYSTSSAVAPLTCGSVVKRTCLSTGQFDGTVPVYPSCLQQCLHPDTGNAVDQNSQYIYYTKSSGSSQADCDSAKYTSICQGTGTSAGYFSPVIANTRYTTCKVQSQTCAYTTGTGIATPTGNMTGATVKGYSSSTATYPALCGNQMTLTCSASGSWLNGTAAGATPLYSACTQKCLHPDTNMPVNSGTTYQYYTKSTGTTADCSAAMVTATCSATTGTFGIIPTSRYTSCTAITTTLVGKALYDQSCASCHNAFETSNLKGRTITAEKITGATTSISAMAPLKGLLTNDQLASLVALFPATINEPTTSSFACASTEAEKNTSIGLNRLNNQELQNTYKTFLPAAAWTALSSSLYLLPNDELFGDIKNFNNKYTASFTDQMNLFNENVATQIMASSTNIQSFFGTCASSSSFAKTCFDSFVSTKLNRILRYAVPATESAAMYTAISAATNPADQMKALIQIIFNDPRFLFHVEQGSATATNGLYPLTSYEVANRLSYGILASPPDDTLWAAAVAGSLTTTTAVSTQVDRLAATAAFQARVVDFIKFYIGKASNAPPTNTDFLAGLNTTGLPAAIDTEFADYVKYIVFTQKGTLNDLLTSKIAFPKTASLASIFGTSTSSTAVTTTNHYGLLSRPYFHLISNENLKLVQRGKSIRVNMLCTDVPQPSASDIAQRPTLTASDLINLNRRDYIDKATMSAASCIVCHSKLNQIGFTTEAYDSVGRFNTTEKIYDANGKKVASHPVVMSSSPNITENDTRTFASLPDFADALSKSDALHQCLTRKTYQFFWKQDMNVTYDSCRANKIDNALKEGKSIYDTLLENFKTTSILYRRGQ